jgi:DNA-binding HxlR family transcriptional regulator
MIHPMAKGPEEHDQRQCDRALARAFDFLGKRWNGMILGTLSTGPAGFAELRRSLATITDSVLSDRLTELTAAGLVSRVITDTKPPGVSYALTSSGMALTPVLDGLSKWAACNLASKDAPQCPPDGNAAVATEVDPGVISTTHRRSAN